jgi:formylglycine-generating enzyme required for sulfatase activity
MGTPQDLSLAEKSVLIQQIIDGCASAQEACARHGISTAQLKDWVREFRRGVQQALDENLVSALSRRGLEVGELSRAEFSGSLEHLGVGELLQTIEMGRKDLHITVTHGGEASEIWCRDGEVVDARSGSLDGEAAFYRILTLRQGTIVADFSAHDRPRRIDLSTPRLLLKAASSNGLRARLMQRIGDPRQVFVVNPATFRRSAERPGDERDVLGLFDGTRSVEEVVFASGLADARAFDIIARLREQQLILPASPANPGAPASESLPSSGNLTMSYRPLSRSHAPEPTRVPRWMLASGAVSCSALGALTVVALSSRAAPPADSDPVSPGDVAPSAAPQPSQARSMGEAPVFHDSPPPSSTRPEALAGSRLPIVASPADLTSERRCPSGMVWLEGGRFTMGTDASAAALSLARPAHRVTLRGFCIDAREVTVGQYAACVKAGDCTPAHHEAHFAAEASEAGDGASVALHGAMCNAGKPNRQRHPINCVSHAQAVSYCAAHAARLPSEAEWEYAARGAADRTFPWGDARPSRERVNVCGQECERWHAKMGLDKRWRGVMYAADDGYAGTAPVGSFPRGASPDGVEDLIGNVFEWTAAGLYEYGVADVHDPRGPSNSESFVIRGGNFNSSLREFTDPSLRFAMHGESYSHGVGFRCAADGPGN